MEPRSENLRALLAACVCLLTWVIVGLAISGGFDKAAQAAAVLAAARVMGLSRADCGLRRPGHGARKPALCFAAAAAVFALLFPAQKIFVEDTAALLRAFVSFCVVAPLSEELAFRGALQGTLRPLGVAGLVLQASAFALLHGGLIQKVYALVMGLALGWLADRTESIWPGAALHTINNLLTLAFSLWRTRINSGAI